MFEEGSRLKERHGAENVFDFSLGNPDLDPPPEFRNALSKRAAEDPKGSHGYMPNAGYPEVRAALATACSLEQGTRLDRSCIVMSCGAAGGLNVVFKTLLNPGDTVVVPSPYFMEYRAYAENHGARLVPVPTLPDFSLDLGAIETALAEKNSAALLINSPHNPTGRVYPGRAIADLARILSAQGRRSGRFPYLIADEPYRDIAYTPVPPVLAAYPHSLVVSSFSKSLSLAGERIGFIAVNPEAADKEDIMNALSYATRVLGFVNAPALMQWIVGDLTRARVDAAVYARRRDCFKAVLDRVGIGYAEPEGAFYLFCQVPGGAYDRLFVDHLASHLILGVPGAGFGAPGWVRFAYCVDEKVIKASEPAFERALQSWQPPAAEA
jgi:aspartate aminotransferase